MTTIKLENAMEIYNELEERTEMITKRAGRMEIKECEENGWTYTFFSIRVFLKKLKHLTIGN